MVQFAQDGANTIVALPDSLEILVRGKRLVVVDVGSHLVGGNHCPMANQQHLI